MHDGYIGVIYKKLLMIKDLKQGISYYRSGPQRRCARNGPRRQGNWASVWRRNVPPEENWTTANCVRQTSISTTFTTFTKKLKYTSPYFTNILLTTALIALDIWILLTRCFLKHCTYLRKITSRCGPHQNHKSSQTQWR